MPITMIKIGETSTIKRITGNDETRHHLQNLGFVIGGNITIVNEMAGNLIVNVKDTRVALSKTMANRIIV